MPYLTEQAHIWQLDSGDIITLTSAQLAADPTLPPLPPILGVLAEHPCRVSFLCWGMPQTLMGVKLLATGESFILDLDTTTKLDRWAPA